MYERHFGFTAPPFRMTPDPELLFECDEHRDVLQAMRETFRRDQPFLAVSGEIGAGKSTLLRQWLDECHADGVAVAHLVNTQLNVEELLSAIATGFGTAPSNACEGDGDARVRVRSCLQGLTGRWALLAIDEAQNLSRDGLRCLVELTGVAAETKVVLRTCLVGQPELRVQLADAAAAGLLPRLQHSRHLGPLGPLATRRYIEHRLMKVGWVGVPSFEEAAFSEIHRFTRGVPRQINALANRLMLSQFLAGATCIDVPSVVTVARAWRAETYEEALGRKDSPVVRGAVRRRVAAEKGGIVLVASGRSDHIKAIPTLQALGACADLPPAILTSMTPSAVAWELDRDLRSFVGVTQEPLQLATDARSTLDDVAAAFDDLIEQAEPRAVIVFDGNPMAECCAMIAHERGVPLVHVGSDAQTLQELGDRASARASIARLAGLRFNAQSPQDAAVRSGLPRAVCAGNVLIDAVRIALQARIQSDQRPDGSIAPVACIDDRRGYGLVVLRSARAGGEEPPCRPDVLAVLREASRDLPLIWLLPQEQHPAMSRDRLARLLENCRVAWLDEPGYSQFVALLLHATCVLTDCADVIEASTVLRVPSITLGTRHVAHPDSGQPMDIEAGADMKRATRAIWQILFNGVEVADPPGHWDGHAASRIAAHIARWLASAQASEPTLAAEGATNAR